MDQNLEEALKICQNATGQESFTTCFQTFEELMVPCYIREFVVTMGELLNGPSKLFTV